MKTLRFLFFSILSALILIVPSMEVKAQDVSPSGPVYIVEEGDSLWNIAYRFHVSQEALANANGITNPDQITIGQPLVIPGLEGIQGVLTTKTVPLGESLDSLSLRYKVSPQVLKRLNHITSPSEVYAGYSLIIPQIENAPPPGKRALLEAGQSLLELAILNNTQPWQLLVDNNIANAWAVPPGAVVRASGEDDAGPGALPPEITSITLPDLTQGQTAEMLVAGSAGLSLTGSLMDHPLNFFFEGENYRALQGVHAMAEPRVYPLTLHISTPDQPTFTFSQSVVVNAGDFLYDRSLPVDPVTLDPETNRTENALWQDTSSQVTNEKLWSGEFFIPVDQLFAECYSSRFGNRRSYNGSAYDYFHTGLDFCGQVGDPIYAAAPGTVVFAGPLTVRGQATMIDHGEGVYSAYMHQSEILVNEGDSVEQGQLIGRVGNTGRVEGPHLHFEVLVGGIQVDPIPWLAGEFP